MLIGKGNVHSASKKASAADVSLPSLMSSFCVVVIVVDSFLVPIEWQMGGHGIIPLAQHNCARA